MDDMPEYVVDPNMRFSDIIVPTVDTVRAHFLLELLISNFKQVSPPPPPFSLSLPPSLSVSLSHSLSLSLPPSLFSSFYVCTATERVSVISLP